MRDVTIARNYADALFTLAERANDRRGWGTMILEVAEVTSNDPRLRRFLESPRVEAAEKSRIIGKAFATRLPKLMVRFLQALVANRRQMLLPEIAREYLALVDRAEGRMHAAVTMATEPSAYETMVVAKELSRAFGQEVVPHVTVNPAILGGIVIRVGDRVMDGSVRRRLSVLRNRMLTGRAAR